MSERVLTVKGIGNVTAKPDLTVITMELSVIQPDYEETMKRATVAIENIRSALTSIGYAKHDLKTTNFLVNAEYENRWTSKHNNESVFVGYNCSHTLKLEFDFNMKRLGDTLEAIAACAAAPQFHIAFSVKDKNAVSAQLLESAVVSAKEKAQILAQAAGINLGAIQRIDYNWGELQVYSPSALAGHMRSRVAPAGQAMDIEPEDIKVTDTVTVVWAIE
jgi:uncharacterized protein YggE